MTGQDDVWERPDDAPEGFSPRNVLPQNYNPPPPTVSPQERAVFGKPNGVESFQPAPGERLVATRSHRAPVPPEMAAAFRTSPGAVDGFDPSPGSRLNPGQPLQSPWWKKDARTDPWRDPNSPFWLGRGAIFTKGLPAQLDPSLDTESDEPDEPDTETDEAQDDDDTKGKRRRGVVVTRRRFGLGALALCLAIALIAGALGGGVGYWVAHRYDEGLHHDNVALSKVDTPANRPPGSVADIAKRVGPAVVSIAITTANGYSIGSGVVIDSDGDVLTNNHVVADAAQGANIEVTFSNEATAEAKIVGRDPVSDLAVIKVPSESLTVATLGDSDTLAVGDPVVAIGSPLGLSGTVTQGIVSAKERAVHVFSDDGTSDAYLNAIQTDAAINPGNSGGPLVNLRAQVIGVNSAIATTGGTVGGQSGNIGVGFAIPIEQVKITADQILRTGSAKYPVIGAKVKTGQTGGDGAVIDSVLPGTPAEDSGLRKGDVITALNGDRVTDGIALIVAIRSHQPGETVEFTIERDGEEKTVSLTLDGEVG